MRGPTHLNRRPKVAHIQNSQSSSYEPLALRTRQAAHTLGISERLLVELTRKGEIPSLTINRARLYRAEALAEWLKAREQGGAA